MLIKIIEKTPEFKIGDIVSVIPSEGHKLIQQGIAQWDEDEPIIKVIPVETKKKK